MTKAQIASFQQLILDWWHQNKRDLPWRHTHDPYKILVSEVMLQQTQVPRVLPKYRAFIDQFPSLEVLAKATPSSVIRAWKGMGYNRRALYLHRTAFLVVHDYKGVFPRDESDLLKLPGIGKYTAGAIRVFAFREHTYMVDTNIRHIIAHYFFNGKQYEEKDIEAAAKELVPIGKSWEWHQALMDYGALALPHIREKKVKKKGGIPFRETNRFFRGRVIDALREKDWDKKELIDYMETTFDRSSQFIEEILTGLSKDFLIVVKHGKIRLP